MRTSDSQSPAESGPDLPPGNHPLEVAARRGVGPLSKLGEESWHGQTRPCVSCGQLVLRDAVACDYCGQDLGPEMVDKMRAHAGPWYVLEHVRPFPGVSLERIVRQIRRGLITETSIVRGPATDHQWRFAVETPGLCRYFGRCWNCHGTVSPSDTTCQHCLSHQSFEKPRPTSGVPTGANAAGVRKTVAESVPPSSLGASGLGSPRTSIPHDEAIEGAGHLERLSAALHQSELPSHEPVWDDPPRIAGIRATWVAAGLLVVVVAALMWIAQARSANRSIAVPKSPSVVAPAPTP